MKCPKCGSDLSINTVNCITCGTFVGLHSLPQNQVSEEKIVSDNKAPVYSEPKVYKQEDLKIEKKKMNKNKLTAIIILSLLLLGLGGFFGYKLLTKKEVKPLEVLTTGEYKLYLPSNFKKQTDKLVYVEENKVIFEYAKNLTADKLYSTKATYISNMAKKGQKISKFELKYLNSSKFLYMEITKNEQNSTGILINVDDTNGILILIDKTDNTFASEKLLSELVDIVKKAEKVI